MTKRDSEGMETIYYKAFMKCRILGDRFEPFGVFIPELISNLNNL
jgi:hypothetical protein